MNIFGENEMSDVNEEYDVVEIDTHIHAPTESVWSLVSEAGWWINDGPLGDHEVSVDEEGIYHVADPEAGEWLVEKVDEDPMDLVAFRWYPLAGDELPEEYATRVEVSLSEENGSIALHVEESGLSTVSDDEDVARSAWENASGMWHEVLAEAKKYLENS
ncbi:SRPBCC family protein [Schaalia sp. lx-100]|uniref:SRPBCC family protein n=1 Tax=Schaalia sp. lx-100 TaxID=2899081 RepID=UPI001E494C30|nr:SRPBCC domain-containing protein [Schaalia sp. lx-100]MCD4557882.1 SRPBCC domain-containing protein [Schaalia sp. lx-100]